MKHKSKLVIIIASYLLLFTHANADNSIFNKIVNNQDLLADEDSDWEDVFEKRSQLLKDRGDKFKHKVKNFRTNFALEWGNSYLKSKEYSKAIVEYNKVIKHKPDCAEAYYGKGEALSELQNYNEAIENYDLAIKYKPHYPEAYNNKGFALLILGRYQEAIENCDLIIKYNPENAYSYLEKGYILSKLNKHKEAEDNFKLVIKYQHNFIEQYESIINKLKNGYFKKQLEERLRLLKKYLAENKQDN